MFLSAARVARLYLESAKYKKKKEVPKADGSGKTTVYEYSKEQVGARNRAKAERIEKLRGSLDSLRAQVKKDLNSKDDTTRLSALAVALMDETYERVGNEQSAKDGHFGVTGWQAKHVSMSGGKATIKYVGKSGVKQEKTVTDKATVKALRRALEGKSGTDQVLCEGDDCKVLAKDVNAYLKPFGVSAKDIRGLHANQVMQDALKSVRSSGGKLPSDEKKRAEKLKAEFKKALEQAAKSVGHEPSTLRSQYLVPGLEDDFMDDGSVNNSLTKKKAADRRDIRALQDQINRQFPGEEEDLASDLLGSLENHVQHSMEAVLRRLEGPRSSRKFRSQGSHSRQDYYEYDDGVYINYEFDWPTQVSWSVNVSLDRRKTLRAVAQEVAGFAEVAQARDLESLAAPYFDKAVAAALADLNVKTGDHFEGTSLQEAAEDFAYQKVDSTPDWDDEGIVEAPVEAKLQLRLRGSRKLSPHANGFNVLYVFSIDGEIMWPGHRSYDRYMAASVVDQWMAKTAIIHINNATDGGEDGDPMLRGFSGLISSLTYYEAAIVQDMTIHEAAIEGGKLRGRALDPDAVTELVGAGYLEEAGDGRVVLSGMFQAKKKLYTASLVRSILAKKDQEEKQDDEAARLIRKSPKKKAPRDDLRRENMKVDDPDLGSKDPDLSMNFKDIGASAKRVAFRWFALQEGPPSMRRVLEAAERQERKPGDVWQTKGGKWSGKNPDGETETFDSKDAADLWAAGQGLPPGEDPDDERESVNPPDEPAETDPDADGSPEEEADGALPEENQPPPPPPPPPPEEQDPFTLGGDPISAPDATEPVSPEALRSRAEAVYDDFKAVDPAARAKASKALEKELKALEKAEALDTPRAQEINAILDGLALAGAMVGQQVEGRGEPSYLYSELARMLRDSGHEKALLGSGEGFASGQAAEVIRESLRTLPDGRLGEMMGGEKGPFGDVVKALNGGPSQKQRAYLREFMEDLLMDNIMLFDPAVSERMGPPPKPGKGKGKGNPKDPDGRQKEKRERVEGIQDEIAKEREQEGIEGLDDVLGMVDDASDTFGPSNDGVDPQSFKEKIRLDWFERFLAKLRALFPEGEKTQTEKIMEAVVNEGSTEDLDRGHIRTASGKVFILRPREIPEA